MPGKKVSRNAQTLLNVLDVKFVVTTQQAMDLLNISEATTRRLFRAMASSGVALRSFCVFWRIQEAASDYSFDVKSNQNSDEKLTIAQKASKLVSSADVLYLDSGTTLVLFAQELAKRMEAGDLKDIIVYTNSITTLDALREKCEVNLVGGRYRENRRDFCGYIAEDAVRKLSFTACFLGADACEDRGLTTTDFETARLSELVCSSSRRRYALVDSGKFSKNSFVSFTPLNTITSIITDSRLSLSKKEEYEEYGARITI